MGVVRPLDVLEWMGRMPAEAWLVPPVLLLSALAARWWIRRRRVLADYRAIAARTGLDVVPKFLDPSEVSGTFAGYALAMCEIGRRRPTWRRRWTRVRVTARNPESVNLRLWIEDAVDRTILALGASEVVTGDAALDRRYVIQSRDGRMIGRMFHRDPALGAALVAAGIDSVELHGTRLDVYYARSERDDDHALQLCKAATALAAAIDRLEADDAPETIHPRG